MHNQNSLDSFNYVPTKVMPTISKAKLPTNLTTGKHVIHRWLNFIAGYSPEYVSSCIQEAGLSKKDILIDPFAGLSTSLIQARLEGIKSIGFEPHPYFYDMSLAKLIPFDNHYIIDHIESFLLNLKPLRTCKSFWSESAIKYLEKLVPEKELNILANAVFQKI